MHWLKGFRDHYSAQTTLGKLYIEESEGTKYYFCETLEDTVRPDGIKVYGNTAIPADLILSVGIRYSPKFKRDMLVLYTHKEGDRYFIRHEGIEFEAVMYHGGNRHDQTSGCPLVCYNRINNETIQGTAEKDLFALIKGMLKTCEVKAIFKNLPQVA